MQQQSAEGKIWISISIYFSIYKLYLCTFEVILFHIKIWQTWYRLILFYHGNKGTRRNNISLGHCHRKMNVLSNFSQKSDFNEESVMTSSTFWLDASRTSHSYFLTAKTIFWKNYWKSQVLLIGKKEFRKSFRKSDIIFEYLQNAS